ncbi:MAG: 16S rRNA (cytosine(967)-C(5))-methyltransferase RsmB [Candidatus Acidiferrales bacterium]
MTASPRKQASRSLSKPSARALAYSILFSVETEAAYASELLRSRLDANLDAREAALATELVMGTLRWQRLLDFFVERYTGRKTPTLDREVLIVLRLGIYQLRYLTRIPAHAAVSESVELVKRARKKSAAPLVNAALRRAASERKQFIAGFLQPGIEPAETLAITYSHPTWLVERWLRNFGEEQTIALLEANNQTPEHGCVFLSAERREDAIRSLDEAGIHFESGRLLRDAIVVRRGNVAGSRAFRSGWIGMQDEASQMIPLLAGAKPGDSVLDLCAAPGGKTIALASLVGEHGHVVAADFHEARLRAMRERLAMAGAADVALVALDGTGPLPFTNAFDRILVDAPCSGTGTLARNPEIRWRLTLEDLADLRRRQVALARSALEHLSSRGALLYSTCSLEPEENESVVSEVLAGNPRFHCEALKIPQGILAAGVSAGGLVDKDGAFRTFPPVHHADGFFAALMVRR